MKREFAVDFYSDAYQTRIVFVSKNRTPTLEEYAQLVGAYEWNLAERPRGEALIIQLGRLPPTDRPTMHPGLHLT